MDEKLAMIVWSDLTTHHADAVRSFYQEVIGVPALADHTDQQTPVPPHETQAAIMHVQGLYRDMPPQWTLYITVKDLHASLDACQRLGGRIITPIRDMGTASVCIIQDPAGAVATLYQRAG